MSQHITTFAEEEFLLAEQGCVLVQAENPKTLEPMLVAVNEEGLSDFPVLNADKTVTWSQPDEFPNLFKERVRHFLTGKDHELNWGEMGEHCGHCEEDKINCKKCGKKHLPGKCSIKESSWTKSGETWTNEISQMKRFAQCVME